MESKFQKVKLKDTLLKTEIILWKILIEKVCGIVKEKKNWCDYIMTVTIVKTAIICGMVCAEMFHSIWNESFLLTSEKTLSVHHTNTERSYLISKDKKMKAKLLYKKNSIFVWDVEGKRGKLTFEMQNGK